METKDTRVDNEEDLPGRGLGIRGLGIRGLGIGLGIGAWGSGAWGSGQDGRADTPCANPLGIPSPSEISPAFRAGKESQLITLVCY